MAESQQKLWRVFCAIELPRELQASLSEYIAQLRKSAEGIKASWARPEGIHITLKFIGEIEQARVRELSLAAKQAVQGVAPFSLTIEGAGAFPPRGQPRVLWLGVKDESGRLQDLQKRLEAECAKLGFEREDRAYRPHLTIARLRVSEDARRLATLHQQGGFAPATFAASEIAVIRSELQAGGSRYTALSRHKFLAH